MNFAKGDYITLDGRRINIIEPLGEGGQGEVYLVEDQGSKYAFKYYKEIPSPDFKYNLRNNIKRGSPSKDFLWPLRYIEFSDETCGYFMDLRPKRYASFVSYLTGKTKFKNKVTLLNWCIELVKSFKELHVKGYSYQDLNDGSFFLDPDNGSLLICDNDNVAADKRSLGILGKMRYMAPEIVRGDKDRFSNDRQMPDTHSDRFSLAVILFLALCMGNPFEGERLKQYIIVDEKAEYEMFGSNPIYVYNRNDASNRPIRGYHTALLRRYPLLPSYIKEAFHKTFTDGLKDRENGRVTEIEWLRYLCMYRDELISCSCGESYIYGFYEKKPNSKCPTCHKDTRRFCWLEVNKHKVLLEPGKNLYKFHLDKYSSEYTTEVAEVIVNPKNPEIWGIRLAIDNDVIIKDTNGKTKTINGHGVIPIINNLTIEFAPNLIGEIHASK